MPLDEHWYKRLNAIQDSVGESFVALLPSAEKLDKAHKAFVASSHQAVVELSPDIVNPKRLLSSRQDADRLLQDILSYENAPQVRELYAERLREVMTNIDMILAAYARDKEAFLSANKSLYGIPDRDIFAASCSWLREEIVSHRDRAGAELCDELLSLLPDIAGTKSLLTPSDEVFQTIKNLHFAPGGFVEQMFGGVDLPDNAIIDTGIGDPIVRQIISNIGSDFELRESPNGLWAVLQSQRQVVRPASMALTKRQFMGIVAHEVGSHLLEATNGARAPLRLLHSGLDRYEAGNEGRAFLREQIMYDRFEEYVDQPSWAPTKASWEYRVAIHMIISLASGLAGRHYNFADAYRLLSTLFRFWTAKRGEPVDEKLIHNGAWSMAVRVFKGTDGAGGAYCKDIVYLEGNIRCWQVAAKRPELILIGDLGKFDISNERHVAALTSLGLIPSDDQKSLE